MKIPRQSFTLEFKELAVKRVRDGERLAVVAKSLGLSDQTLRNWVKAADQGSLQKKNGVIEKRGQTRLRFSRTHHSLGCGASIFESLYAP